MFKQRTNLFNSFLIEFDDYVNYSLLVFVLNKVLTAILLFTMSFQVTTNSWTGHAQCFVLDNSVDYQNNCGPFTCHHFFNMPST